MPSAIHYVGYVEEDETPEMIMKKFEELEKVRRCQSMALPVATLMPLCSFNTFLDADNLGNENLIGLFFNFVCPKNQCRGRAPVHCLY